MNPNKKQKDYKKILVMHSQTKTFMILKLRLKMN